MRRPKRKVNTCHVRKQKTIRRNPEKSTKFPVKQIKVARSDNRYLKWEIKDLKDGQKTFLKSLETKGAISIFKEYDTTLNLLVEGSRALQIERLLRSREISFDMLTPDSNMSTQPSVRRVRSPRIAGCRSPVKKRVMDWKDYYPLQMVYALLDDLESSFPSICTVDVIGKSVEGRDIKMLKISNSNTKNTGVWLDGTIHAREWITTSVVTYLADHIARNFNKLPKFVTNKDWYFVPVLNPDGYAFSHNTDRMWRKSRARYNGMVAGVDLNRNFGTTFTRTVTEGSSDDPTHINFRGSEPFSEPETAAMKDFLLYSATPFKIFLTFHSYSEVIAFPWCDSADPCPDYVTLLEGAAKMAKAIYQTNGRMYKVGGFKDIMYFASGTSIDWSYGTARIPFSYLLELRSKEHKFLLPKEEILDCCKEVLNAIMALAEFVDQHTCLNCTVFSKRHR